MVVQKTGQAAKKNKKNKTNTNTSVMSTESKFLQRRESMTGLVNYMWSFWAQIKTFRSLRSHNRAYVPICFGD